MRYFLIFVLLLASITDFAQNYSLIVPGRTSWYQTDRILESPYGYFCYNDTCLIAVNIDSSNNIDDISIHYLNRMIGSQDGDLYERCEHESLFGGKLLLTDSFQIIVRNTDMETSILADSFFIYFKKNVGEEWLFNSSTDDLFFYATISDKTEENILGTVDSVITFILNAKNFSGENIEHPFDGKTIKLSKNTGATFFYDLQYFPSDTSVKKLTGLTEPFAGTQPPNKNKIFSFEPGDEFHYISSYHNNFGFANSYSEMSKIILNKTFSVNADTIIYETQRNFYKHSWSGIYSDIYDTVCYIDSFITEKFILSEYGFLDSIGYKILDAAPIGLHGYTHIYYNAPFGFVKQVPMYYILSDSEEQCMNSIIATGYTPVRNYADNLGETLYLNSDGNVESYTRLVYFSNASNTWGEKVNNECYNTSIVDIQSEQFNIFNQFVQEQVELIVPNSITNGKYEIYSTTGQLIEKGDVINQNNKLIVNVENLPSGLYLIAYKMEKNIFTSKFVKVIK